MSALGHCRSAVALHAPRPTLHALTALIVFAATAHAQVAPNLDWRTLQTPHFFVEFTPPLEGLARRIAADAERAYAQLAHQLHPPRGMIDLVISDDVDFSNGSATPYPSNRIIVYANPPVSESALRYTNDWGQMVITHELTHIFHLDRTRGIWALGQDIFGRADLLFPNLYSPSWLTEGLAVYMESKLAGAGRVEGSEHRMIARAAAIDHAFPPLGALSLAAGRYPFGETAYAYGSLFIDYLARTRGEGDVRTFVEKSSAQLIPYLINIPAKAGFGISFSDAWREFQDSIARTVASPPGAPFPNWRQLTNDGVYVFDPRWIADTALIYSGAPGRESFGAFRVDTAGNRRRVGRRNSQSPNVPVGNNSFVYAQLDFVNPYQQRSDLWVQRGRKEQQITFGQRLADPDVRGDGEIVAQQIIPGATRLVRVSANGKRVTPITTGSYDEQWTEPRWSHSGTLIAASRWLRGNISQIVVLDTAGRIVHVVSSGVSIESTPSWLPDDSGILYASDRTGATQVYLQHFDDSRHFANAVTYRLSSTATGLFEPAAAPSATRAAAVLFRGDGYHLGVGSCCAGAERVDEYRDTVPPANYPVAPILIDSGPVTKYNPWRSFMPRYWLPTLNPGIEGGYRIGAMTSGFDVVGRHIMSATLEIPTNNTGVTGTFDYQYAGFGLPIIQVEASQDWQSLGGVFARDAARTFLGEIRQRQINSELLATWLRTRYRTALSLTGGVGLERFSDVSTPDSLLALVDTNNTFGTHVFPSVIVGAGFANYQRPPFSISPEDGVQLNVTMRDRLESGANGTGGQSLSTVGQAFAYKSLDFPGFAHHVLALRGSAGWAGVNTDGYYTVGGVNGSTFQIIPGYVIGQGENTFPVRGYQSGTLVGTRAVTASAEYRIPLLLTGRSPGALPFFLDRSSLSLFYDYGTAWCPSIATGRQVCNVNTPILTDRFILTSAGAELNVNLGVLSWDAPYRFRLGVASPLENRALFGDKSVQVYVVAGVSF